MIDFQKPIYTLLISFSYILVHYLYQTMNQETLQIVQKNITNYVEKWKSSEKLDAVWAAKLGLSSVAAYFLYKTIIYRLYIHPANRLPGPRVSWIPFMGNFFEIKGTEVDQSPLRKWAKAYGSIYTIHTQLNKPEIVVTDEKLIKQILTTQLYDFEKPDIVSRELERLTGRGVLVVEVKRKKYIHIVCN